MRATIDFLRQRFETFNRDIFSSRLPMPELHITQARSFVGQFRYERRGSLFRTKEIRHLSLSSRYDLPENVLEDIVIHEMIHYYIHWSKQPDTSSHGRIFQQMMYAINRSHGRHISISHRCSKEELDSDDSKSHSIVCLCRMADGRHLACRVAKNCVFDLHDAFRRWPEVVEEEWYWVYGSYFNRYRNVRTPKLYKIDEEGMDIIKAGTILEFAEDPAGRRIIRPRRNVNASDSRDGNGEI